MSRSTQADFTDDTIDWSPPKPSGYEERFSSRDTCESLAEAGAREFPSSLWIEPKDWKAVAEQNDEYGTWPDDWRSRRTSQGSSHECVAHATIQNFEIAWNRQRQSKKDQVWMSPLSLYAELNPRRWGGTYCQKAVNLAMSRGILPEYDGPEGPDTQKEKFSHTLNLTSGFGDWKSLSQFPAGWRSTAKTFRPHEIINVSSWEEHVCLVLNGYCVTNGRAGHSIPHTRILWRNNSLYSAYSDSYNIERQDSVSYIRLGVGGAFSIASTITPNDWSHPTG